LLVATFEFFAALSAVNSIEPGSPEVEVVLIELIPRTNAQVQAAGVKIDSLAQTQSKCRIWGENLFDLQGKRVQGQLLQKTLLHPQIWARERRKKKKREKPKSDC
jgi:hypothetical protein